MSCYTTCILNNDAILYPIADPQPVVECSFFTEFEDHIFVAMDIELLLFLKNVIMSYVKEKDKGVCDREVANGDYAALYLPTRAKEKRHLATSASLLQ